MDHIPELPGAPAILILLGLTTSPAGRAAAASEIFGDFWHYGGRIAFMCGTRHGSCRS